MCVLNGDCKDLEIIDFMFRGEIMYHCLEERNGKNKEILAYFKTGKTNAYAESLNAKLQRFLRDNFGIKNLDFFPWRINKIFS